MLTWAYKAIAPTLNRYTGRLGFWIWAEWEFTETSARVVRVGFGRSGNWS